MKNILKISLVFSLLFLAFNCQEGNDSKPFITSKIVGKWKLISSDGHDTSNDSAYFIFKSNGEGWIEEHGERRVQFHYSIKNDRIYFDNQKEFYDFYEFKISGDILTITRDLVVEEHPINITLIFKKV